MTERRAAQLKAFEKILDIMDELREKCPWDRKQTIESLRPLTIEETFELSDAITKNDYHNISKELGDILLHIIFYAKIGEEQGRFSIVDVIEELSNKLIYRHPHVFSDTKVKDAGEVIANWEQLKTKEKDGNKTILMKDGRIVMQLEGEERKQMTVEKLIEKFSITSDRILLQTGHNQ